MIYSCKWLYLGLVVAFSMFHASSPGLHQVAHPEQSQHASSWLNLGQGFDYAEFQAPTKSERGDSLIRALRIDTRYFALKLVNASATPDQKSYTAKQWATRYQFVAAINPSMYQRDFLTSTALMKTHAHTNQPYLSKDNTILAFNPRHHGLPSVTLIDRECDDFQLALKNYDSLIQSIRMISCTGKNVWAQQPHRWSTAVIALDKSGRILFIHVRSPFSTHDLINHLLSLPLEIDRAMYAEGGSEAQLYIKCKNFEREFVGFSEKQFLEKPTQNKVRPLPNILGVLSKYE